MERIQKNILAFVGPTPSAHERLLELLLASHKQEDYFDEVERLDAARRAEHNSRPDLRREANALFWRELEEEVARTEAEWRRLGQCFTCDRASSLQCSNCFIDVCWSCSNQSSVYVQMGLWDAEVLCCSCSGPETMFPPGFHDRLAGKR